MISSLISFVDTEAFFDKFYGVIGDLRLIYKINFDKSILDLAKSDLKHKLAWFAFEETTCMILLEYKKIIVDQTQEQRFNLQPKEIIV